MSTKPVQTCDSEDGLNTLSTDAVVHHAQVFSWILDLGFFDDEGASNLLDSLIQTNQFFVVGRFHELVPSIKG